MEKSSGLACLLFITSIGPFFNGTLRKFHKKRWAHTVRRSCIAFQVFDIYWVHGWMGKSLGPQGETKLAGMTPDFLFW